MKNCFVLLVLLGCAFLLAGCVAATPIEDVKRTTFNDTGDALKNDETCYNFCLERVRASRDCWCMLLPSDKKYCKTPQAGCDWGKPRYHCSYEPVVCSDGECMCKTR